MRASVGVAEFSVCAERLHEPLHGAQIVDGHELRFVMRAGAEETAEVVVEQFLALRVGERHVRIEKERGEIVLSKAGAETLEVDETGLAVANHHILALEIPMDQTARLRGEMRGNLQKPRAVDVAIHLFRRKAEVPPEAVLDEIVLLPFIKRDIEFLLEFRALRRCVRAGVKDERLVEGPLVKGASLDP